jgi:hypothetical protein
LADHDNAPGPRLRDQYRFPAGRSTIIGQARSSSFASPFAQIIIISLDPGWFLNRLSASLILISRAMVLAAVSIDCGKRA